MKAEVGDDNVQIITFPQGCKATVSGDDIVRFCVEGGIGRVNIEVADGVAQIIGSSIVGGNVRTIFKMSIPLTDKLGRVLPDGDETEPETTAEEPVVSLGELGSADSADATAFGPRDGASPLDEDPATVAARHAETVETTPEHRAIFVEFIAWVVNREPSNRTTLMSEAPALRQRIAIAQWTNDWREYDTASAIARFGDAQSVFFMNLVELPDEYVDCALGWARASTQHNPPTDADEIRALAAKHGVAA